MNTAKLLGNKRPVRATALNLPFKSNSFDFFLSDHFLFCNYDFRGIDRGFSRTETIDFRILEELHRVLRPEGIGTIWNLTTPNFFSSKPSAIRGFDVAEFRLSSGKSIKWVPLFLVLRKKK